MMGSEEPTPPPDVPRDERDEDSDPAAEFEESVTAVTEERKLSEKLRRELNFRERVRKHLSRRATEDDSEE